MKHNLAPIVLFVYNRPWHTRQTLVALSKNLLADQSTLFIYADGSKENATDKQLLEIKEVRSLIKEKKWCNEVKIIEREKNIGVDNGIIIAVTELINKYGKIIVLEDDIVTSPFFLEYMNLSLNLYEKKNDVMVISGYNFPILKKMPDTFFLYGGTCPWGWGTWKRAWNFFIFDSQLLFDKINNLPNKKIKQFNYDNNYDYVGMLKASISNNCPYDIRWYASVFLNGGLGLWPGKSLVQNIGHDNSGVHCKPTNAYYHKDLAACVPEIKQDVQHNEFAYSKIASWYKKLNYTSFSVRIKNKVKRFFNSSRNF